MAQEQYSVQAETLMRAAVEDFTEIIQDVQASNANMNIIKGIRVTINGKPRRLVDVGDLKTGESDNQLKVLVFNTDHIELILDQIHELDFETSVDGQFITINVPDPSYKQLMEVVDDLNRKKNSAVGRLTKAKSEATTRARAAVENEFIEQAVASKASKQCDVFYDEYSTKITEITMDKILEILGEEYFNKYKTEELDLE
tara:strand:- start:8583 stop:9182 length:600 start_codon:yes stop_codon:yes gene_type:complete